MYLKTSDYKRRKVKSMIALRKLSQDLPDFQLVKKLYFKAFPSRERIDLPVLFHRVPAVLFGIYTGKEASRFAGFFIVIEDELMVYLHYFTLCPEICSADVGDQALHALVEVYRGRPVMTTYEGVCPGAGFYECPWRALYEEAEYGLASSEMEVGITAMQHLLHLFQSFKANFHTHIHFFS